jgi:hypothetical protein
LIVAPNAEAERERRQCGDDDDLREHRAEAALQKGAAEGRVRRRSILDEEYAAGRDQTDRRDEHGEDAARRRGHEQIEEQRNERGQRDDRRRQERAEIGGRRETTGRQQR